MTDGRADTSVVATFHVLNANAPPRFESLENWLVYEDQPVLFQATAFDPDHPEYSPPQRAADGSLLWLHGIPAGLAYSVAGLPDGAVFDSDTTIFGWWPDFADAGQYDVVFTVTDDGDGTGIPLTSSVTTHITVLNANRSPQIPPLANVSVAGGTALVLPVTVTDPDGDAVTLQVAHALPGYPLPDFITFTDLGHGQGRFDFAPELADRGDYAIVLTATDDAGGGNWTERRSASQTFVVSVEADNVPPRFDYVGNAVAVIGQPLALTVQARDLDGENLSFALTGLPPAATLTPGPVYGTAVLRWTPTAADAGSHMVRLDVTDTGNGHPALVANDSVQFTLLVRSTNAAPVLTLVDQSVAEGQTLTLALAAGDQDGDALRYAAHNLPQGATLDPQQGLLQWTPHLAQAGDYPNVQFSVTDGHSTDTANITIHVTNTNQAPRFAATSSQYVHENYELEFVIVAQDNDQDAVVYSSPGGLPLGAHLDARTGRFRWTPKYDQAGTYPVTFVVSDAGGLTDTMGVVLHVVNVNRPPVLSVGNHSVPLGTTLEFLPQASDPDAGTTLVFGATNLPEGATLDPQTGRFVWTPGPGAGGRVRCGHARVGRRNHRFHIDRLGGGHRAGSPPRADRTDSQFPGHPGSASACARQCGQPRRHSATCADGQRQPGLPGRLGPRHRGGGGTGQAPAGSARHGRGWAGGHNDRAAQGP